MRPTYPDLTTTLESVAHQQQRFHIQNTHTHQGHTMIRFIIYFYYWRAGLAGFKITVNPGYMVIAYQHWTIEAPLWLAQFQPFRSLHCVLFSISG